MFFATLFQSIFLRIVYPYYRGDNPPTNAFFAACVNVALIKSADTAFASFEVRMDQSYKCYALLSKLLITHGQQMFLVMPTS